MSIDRLLAFIVVGLTCLLAGGVGGLLIGAHTEQNAIVTFLARANLSDDCKNQIDQAIHGSDQNQGEPTPSQ
jgi:uncharacterized membrane protein